ncbi:MAG: fluoride efflux transporter CrcB [Bacteroidetes bacterium]|nr:MAG: fluoride efflux transporter CrcB [Bacteroidota bacterium]
MAWLYVFIGGGAGSICRFVLGQWLNRTGGYPWGTLAANSVSCIVLGILVAYTSKEHLALEWRLLLMTGFCGGFSTFSTFSNEVLQFMRQADYPAAMLYVGMSLLVGLFSLWLGLRLLD